MSDNIAGIMEVLERQADAMAAGAAAAMAGDFVPDPVQNTLDVGVQQAWIDRWDEHRPSNTATSGRPSRATWPSPGASRAPPPQGRAEDTFWTRNSWAFGRMDGAWRIIHAHASVPFYMDGSARAAIDLEPEAGPARTS